MPECFVMKEKTVGILGGMGPAATADLMSRVIRATPATDDIDHIRMVIDNNPKVPSRIAAVVEGVGEDPAPILVEMARKLAAWGVDLLAIPCNTAHLYYNQIVSAVDVPVLNMVELTRDAVIADNPGIRSVGLLASTAVLTTRLYAGLFAANDVDVIQPSADLQDALMTTIRQLKAGQCGHAIVAALRLAADQLVNKGAESLVIACTELSLIAHTVTSDVTRHDSAQVLAETIVGMAKGLICLRDPS
jgi:aspartate racemase